MLIGVTRVAQRKLKKAPMLAGQAPYSGIKYLTTDGVLVDSSLLSAQNGQL